jgi:acyl-CoA thioesterase-1
MKKSHLIIIQKLILLSLLLLCLSKANAINKQEQRILVFGDSISAGYGLPTNTGWVTLLEQYLKNEKYNFSMLNASISGETSAGGKSRIVQLLRDFKPNVVIVELGANDALRGFPLKVTYTNLLEIINICKANKAQVLLLGMKIPSNYGAEYTNQFSKMFLDVSKSTQSTLVPFFLEGIATNRQLFQDDGIHPNIEAQPILFQTMLPSLVKILK